MNKKRLFALAAIFLLSGIGAVFAIGWALAAPVQISVGKPPADLGAQAVEFNSDSGTSVHAWWCPVAKAHCAVVLLPGIRRTA